LAYVLPSVKRVDGATESPPSEEGGYSAGGYSAGGCG